MAANTIPTTDTHEFMRREECLVRHQSLHDTLDDIKGQNKAMLVILSTIFIGLLIKFIAS